MKLKISKLLLQTLVISATLVVGQQQIFNQTKGNFKQTNTKRQTSNSNECRGHMLAPCWHNPDDQLQQQLFNQLNSKLIRFGPEMKPSRDYHDFTDITLADSKLGWRLWHEQAAKTIQSQVDRIYDDILNLLTEARVSKSCIEASTKVMKQMGKLDSWPLKLANSWGTFPPSGLFEGTYSSLGAYDTCLSLPEHKNLQHSHFCFLNFRPVIPSDSNKYRLFFDREPLELRELFKRNKSNNYGDNDYVDSDAFEELAEQAHYHHYVYYKIGSCWPISCSPFDVARVARRLASNNVLMLGPVKCYSRFEDDYQEPGHIDMPPNQQLAVKNDTLLKRLEISVWDKNDGIFIWKPFMNAHQQIALVILTCLSGLILVCTLIDLLFKQLPRMITWFWLSSDHSHPIEQTQKEEILGELHGMNLEMNGSPSMGADHENVRESATSGGMAPNIEVTKIVDQDAPKRKSLQNFSFVHDCSLISNAKEFFECLNNSSTDGNSREIACVNGIRCITMTWIIVNHSMMYYDWSQFAKTRAVETHIASLATQPIFNGSYLVDSFFLLSGLLGGYTTFLATGGSLVKFKPVAYVLGRYLRLTPQVLLVALILMVLPLLSWAPNWHSMAGEYAENCFDNWWLSALHLQAYVKTERMCNYPTWWLSVEFSLHVISVLVVWAFLAGGLAGGSRLTIGLTGSLMAWALQRHYWLALPPNFLASLAQANAVWSEMSISFFWRPYSHAFPFFIGLLLGYLLALKRNQLQAVLNRRRAAFAWTLTLMALLAQAYSTHWWVTGQARYTRLQSTLHLLVCSSAWSLSLAWIIVACHCGYGGFINSILSCNLFRMLSRASYLVYLTHIQLLFVSFGTVGVLLEPTQTFMSYIIVGNIFLATLYGCLLHVAFEMPWLKAHRALMRHIRC